VVVRGVVVAIDPALARRDEETLVGEAPVGEVGDLEIEMSRAGGRNESDLFSVRRDPRLEVDAVIRRERACLAGREIELPQLHGMPVVTREDDALAVARNVRLVVVGGIGMGQLDSNVGTQ
jgi:hypothetical protein